MIPILYEADEQDFASNGLGRLSDTIACNVEEERNGSYELTMTYPITGIHFEDICLSRFVYAVPADGKSGQPFRIYHIAKPINGIIEIHAEHISYQLSHIPVSPFEAETIYDALTGLVNYSAESNPFTFLTDKTTSAHFSVNVPTSCRALLGGMEGSIIDAFGGGEYEFDMHTVKLYQNRGIDSGVILRYGKNITDIKQEENIANTYTGVYPYWKGNDGGETEIVFTLPEKVIHSASALNFPYQRTVALDLSSEWDSKPTEAQLRNRANAYMISNNIGTPSVSIDVSFVALWQSEEYSGFANLERVNLCDTVTVYFSKLGISAQAKVVKTNYNVLKERYDSIELGDAKSNFASQIKDDISESYSDVVNNFSSKSFLQKSVERATKLITGGLGGYVVMNPNADGEPQEILIMDTDDIQTAVNVIRINRNGIGFSTNGYEGPFISAWTIDGHFVADFIDSGTMSADRIQGGTLTLGGINNTYGVLSLLSADGVEIGRIDRNGADISGNLRMTYDNFISDAGLVDSYYTQVSNVLCSKKTGSSQRFISNDVVKASETLSYWANTDSTYTQNRDELVRCLTAQTEISETYLLMKYARIEHEYPDAIYYSNVPMLRKHFTTSGYEIKCRQDDTIPLLANLGFSEIYAKNNTCYLGVTSSSFSASYDDPYSSSNDFYIALNKNGLSIHFGDSSFTVRSSSIGFNGTVIHSQSSSSIRYKHDIKPLSADLDPHKLLKLQAKEFVFNDDHPLQYQDMKGQVIPGFIAEDVAEIYPSAVIHKDGKVESWDERRIIPAMLSLIQEQHEEIQALKSELSEIKELLKGVAK